MMQQAVRDDSLTPPVWEDWDGFSNARNLDEFYVAAHGGWDFETGEVVDREREAAVARDNTSYQQ